MLYPKPTSTSPIVHDPRLPTYRPKERSSALSLLRLAADRPPKSSFFKLPINMSCVFGERSVAARSRIGSAEQHSFVSSRVSTATQNV